MKNWNDPLVDNLPKETRSAINKMWHNMHLRCKHNENYKDVSVCPEWQSFPAFVKWVINESNWCFAEHKNLVLSRLGDKGNYTPENCTFYTKAESTRESRQNCYIVYYSSARNLEQSREVFFGLQQLVELTGKPYSTLLKHVDTDKFINTTRTQPFKIYKLA